MKAFKIWYCKKMIKFCEWALKYKHYATEYADVNDMIETRDYFIAAVKKLEALK